MITKLPAKFSLINLLMIALVSTCWFGTSLQAEDFGLPVMSAEETAIMNRRIADDMRTPEQMQYESDLQHAAIVYKMLKSLPSTTLPKAIKDKRALNDADSHSITTMANLYLSINAPLYEDELPEVFALWAELANLIDEAESLKLYIPPANLAEVLTAWRMKKQLDAETNAAPWIVGPQQVLIDESAASITIPAGFKFLSVADNLALQNRIYAIKQAAITQHKLGYLINKNDAVANSLVMPIDGKWSASIRLVNNRYVDFDGDFTHNQMALSDAFLTTIKSRRNPTGNLHWQEAGSYNQNLVQWIVPPTRDLQNDSMQWALTDGSATQALGIDYVYLKLGKNQQVVVTLNRLNVAQSLAHFQYLPAGKFKADYLPENVLNPVLTSIKPLLDSIQFKQGFQRRNANLQDKQSQISLASLIVGQPNIVEQGVKRIVAEQERKNNFWYFLQDHPRYQARFLSVLVLLVVALRIKTSNLSPKDWSGRLLVVTSKIVTLLAVFFGACLVWLNFLS